jgi:glycosyl transferase, family 25
MPTVANSPTRRTQRASQPSDTPLFLINLDAATQRRQHMLAQLQARGVAARRIGIDCRTLSRQQIAARAGRRFPAIRFAFESLSGAEIGCWMSHLAAWAAFLSSGTGDACAVIEDDVILAPEFARVVDALAAQDSYDVIYLGTSSKNLSARRRTRINGVWVHEPVGAIYNTWGYVIRREYLERLFAIRPLRLRVPIDHVLGGRTAASNQRVAVVQPVVVREDPSFGRRSQIEPYTWRLDRWRLVEMARRAFLGSRVSDWYYALVKAF